MSPRVRPRGSIESDIEGDWLNPFWVREISIASPWDVEACARRLETLGGNPNWFQSDFTSGRITRRDFHLAGRFGNKGVYHAAAVARGTLRAHGEGTRVTFRVRYAVGPLLSFAILLGLVILSRSDLQWMLVFGVAALLGWVGLLWLSHRVADLLVNTIALTLAVSSEEGDAREGRRSRTTREVLIGEP